MSRKGKRVRFAASCQVCKKSFYPRTKFHVYCSSICANKMAVYQRYANPVTRKRLGLPDDPRLWPYVWIDD